MSKQTPYMKSRYPRIKNDDYQTIDTRCIDGLIAHIDLTGKIIDCCANQGSGIVKTLVDLGYDAVGVADAFNVFEAHWVVDNPPYIRSKVDRIIYYQIGRIRRGELFGVAMLLPNNFDYAMTREPMFNGNEFYYGQIKLRFRPWWTKSRAKTPFHNFLWHVWKANAILPPRVMYYTAPYDLRYVADKPKKKVGKKK